MILFSLWTQHNVTSYPGSSLLHLGENSLVQNRGYREWNNQIGWAGANLCLPFHPFTLICLQIPSFFLSGGWTLIGRFLTKDNNPDNLPSVTSNSYREILPKYKSNNHYLLRKGFNQLRNDMGFTQIRFYCFKKKVGRVLHIMTNKDSKGANVLAYLTDSNSFPRACGSFTRLGDDHSILARNCDKWGHPTENRWGHSGYLKDNRLFSRALLIPWARYYQFIGSLPHSCDDDVAKDIAMSLGDLWQMFVR